MICKILTIAGIALVGAMVAAQAMDIHPECKTMKDKIGCTCALNNGGRIVPYKYRFVWVSRPQGTNRAGVNEAFVQCMKRNGRG